MTGQIVQWEMSPNILQTNVQPKSIYHTIHDVKTNSFDNEGIFRDRNKWIVLIRPKTTAKNTALQFVGRFDMEDEANISFRRVSY